MKLELATVPQNYWSKEEYRKKLFYHELRPNRPSMTPVYMYPDEPEPSFEDCLVVEFMGRGIEELNGQPGKFFNMFAECVVGSSTDSYYAVSIKYDNINTPRLIGIHINSMEGLLKKGIIIKNCGNYYVNNRATIEDFNIKVRGYAQHPDYGFLINRKAEKQIKLTQEFNKMNSEIEGEGTYGYHQEQRVNLSKGSDVWRIGIEIEKINRLNDRVSASKLLEKSNHIIKERDSSLGTYGNEYVTGILSFNSVNSVMNKLKPIKHIINMKFDTKTQYKKAGGHINISEKGLSGFTLAEQLKAYMPLLYAIYPERAFRPTYSTAGSFDSLTKTNRGKNAIYPKQNLLEIRIFPAIDDWLDLRARIALVRHMLVNKAKRYSTVIKQLHDPNSELNAIISKLKIKNKDKLLKRYVVFSKLDNARLTKEAQAILKELGLDVEEKRTLSEWSKLSEDVDNKVPRSLRATYLELGEKVV